VPLITPVELLSVRPAGSNPTVSAHVYGDCPPEALSVVLYAAVTVPSGSAAVVIVKPE